MNFSGESCIGRRQRLKLGISQKRSLAPRKRFHTTQTICQDETRINEGNHGAMRKKRSPSSWELAEAFHQQRSQNSSMTNSCCGPFSLPAASLQFSRNFTQKSHVQVKDMPSTPCAILLTPYFTLSYYNSIQGISGSTL